MSSRSLGHRAPLLWLVIPLIAGLAAARVRDFAPLSVVLALAASAAVVAIATVRNPRPLFRPALVASMFFAGMASYTLHRPRIADWDQLPPREARVSIEVQRVFPQIEPHRASGIGRIVRADAPLDELVGQRVYFSVTLRADTPPPLRTAVISTRGVIASLPRDPAPNSFDGYLADAGVNFRFSRALVLDEERPAHAYYRFCGRQADRFTSILGAGVDPKRPEFVGVLRAMLLGRSNELTDEQDTLFRQTGTMHVFSISGLHIAVIAAGLHALLLLLRLPRLLQFVIGLVALWLYVDITGAAPSAVRAFLMVALVQTSLVLRTPRNPIAALTASALLVILIAPLQVFSASFQLSYGIVAALLLLGLPLSDQLQAKLALFRDLPPVSWSWRHHLLASTWRATLAALSLGIAASLVSALAGVMFFELFTPGALIANLWLIPASSAVILTGFISLLCGLVGFTFGSEIANHAAVLLLWAIDYGVRLFAIIPGAWFDATFHVTWLGPATFALLLATMAAGYAAKWRGWSRGFWPPVAFVALTLLLAVRFP